MSLICAIYKISPFNFAKRLIIRILLRMDVWNNSLREIYRLNHGINIGYGTYGGCFDLSNIPQNVTFGNYCSIASGVRIFRTNHPLDSFTTHPLLYNPVMGFVKKDMLDRPKLDIGHDVWIGANAIITPSVTKIGNGAVIGAGAVVTKNVAPYTIVAGNPAKLIKYRFNDRQIEYLENIKWWNLNKDELIDAMSRYSTELAKLK